MDLGPHWPTQTNTDDDDDDITVGIIYFGGLGGTVG
jgi:hypothetical protein